MDQSANHDLFSCCRPGCSSQATHSIKCPYKSKNLRGLVHGSIRNGITYRNNRNLYWQQWRNSFFKQNHCQSVPIDSVALSIDATMPRRIARKASQSWCSCSKHFYLIQPNWKKYACHSASALPFQLVLLIDFMAVHTARGRVVGQSTQIWVYQKPSEFLKEHKKH